MALTALHLVPGKLYIFYQAMHTTLIEVENFKLGILFLSLIQEILSVWKKNDGIEIVAAKFNNSIYEVKLLDGFYKGKTYYLIADELEKNFKQEIEDNDNI